jgi:hypothetical protein
VFTLCALALAALISGCAGLLRPAEDWPSGLPAEVVSEIPPRAYFVEVYHKDRSNEQLQSREEYLIWVLRFYRGWGPAPTGWLGFERQFLRDASPQSHEGLKVGLQSLGKLVSGEWSKHERVRRIDSRMLLIWSDVLQEAKRQAKERESLELIAQDVTALVSRELGQHAIKRQRYLELLNLARSD